MFRNLGLEHVGCRTSGLWGSRGFSARVLEGRVRSPLHRFCEVAVGFAGLLCSR